MSDEYRRQWLDEIKDNIQNIRRLFLALCDKDSTSKQRRALTKAQDQLDAYEKKVVEPLKKKMGL
jgi:hypothetical protein